MQTVRDACQLQPNALSIKLSDQVEQLDELITAEGDGDQFFEKTYITQGMQDLISEGMARLAGVSTQGAFHLKQAMGGGKIAEEGDLVFLAALAVPLHLHVEAIAIEDGRESSQGGIRRDGSAAAPGAAAWPGRRTS